MKIIITCDEDRVPDALALVQSEIATTWDTWRGRYSKVGWGWAFHKSDTSFFVRRIVDGLSLTQTHPAQVDRNPEGQDAEERLGAKHESAGRKASSKRCIP